MVYERQLGDERCLVVINPSNKTAQVTLPPSTAGIEPEPKLIGGTYKRCTYRPSRKGDVIVISPTSAAILQF